MAEKKIISLHGSYFGNNYGDILLVNLFAKWIKEICPDCIINMPLADKKKTKELPEGLTGIGNLLRSKCLIFCGGGYFGEQSQNKKRWAFRNFLRHGIVGLLCILFKIPYAIIGVEFGPLSITWFRKVSILIARHAKVLVVRNVESKFFLEKCGVENVILSADAVLTLSDIVKPIKNRDKKEILFHIPNIFLNLEILKPIISFISNKRNDYSIALINDSFEPIFEAIEYKPLFEMLEESGVKFEVYSYSGYKQLINQINNSKYIITTKLHVGITAAALNIRPLSLWYHHKTPRLHTQIGNSEFCKSIYDTDDIANVFSDYLTESSQYYLPVDIMKLALKNKEILNYFLTQTVCNRD